MKLDDATRGALFQYLLRRGDDLLVLGHRLSEWCGHGPILEEDIALTNVALDCVGQAQALLAHAGEVEGTGRTADNLAYLRDEVDYRNVLLVEQPNGDFAMTMAREFLFDSHAYLLYEKLREGTHEPLAAIAAKSFKEIRYHLRHGRDWILRLGDGTEESHDRLQRAVDELWTFTGELFEIDDVERRLVEAGIAPDTSQLEPAWRSLVGEVFDEATIQIPEDGYRATGGRTGRHSEHLGHMLSEMQIVARSHPGAGW